MHICESPSMMTEWKCLDKASWIAQRTVEVSAIKGSHKDIYLAHHRNKLPSPSRATTGSHEAVLVVAASTFNLITPGILALRGHVFNLHGCRHNT
jgi:hypothetical protein